MRKEYAIDTGGPGRNRGGAGVRRDTYWLEPGVHGQTTLHTKSPNGVGANGGKSGGLQACWYFAPESFDVAKEKKPLPVDDGIYAVSTPIAGMINPITRAQDPKGDYVYFAKKLLWDVGEGASLRFQTGGGGGWGDPLARDPVRVMHDVRDEYVSVEGALRDYGVVVEGDPLRYPERLTVDLAATEKARAEMRAVRA
jgi:N-methylhydantoinase B